MKFKIKKNPKRGTCHLWGCNKKTEGRGLCKKHYRYCAYHDLFDIYGVPPYRGYNRVYKINKKAAPRECRMIVDGINCDDSMYSRGFCHKHYNRTQRRGELKKIALKPYTLQRKKYERRNTKTN